MTTPYPGTEIWHTESRKLVTRDYRLFDMQHAVVPATLPLEEFYRELALTQQVINRKFLGLRTAAGTARVLGRNLAHGQANFARMLWRFNNVYSAGRQHADHRCRVSHEIPLPPRALGILRNTVRAALPSDAPPKYVRRPTGSAVGAFGLRQDPDAASRLACATLTSPAVVYISCHEVDDFEPAQRRHIAEEWRLIQLLAIGVVLVIAVVMAITSVLAAYLCMRALRRRRERRDWIGLVTRNRELDRRLTRIWKGR